MTSVPAANGLRATIDDEGSVTILLFDENDKAFAGVVIELEQIIEVIEDLGEMVDKFLDDNLDNDAIGPCEGSA